MGAQDYTPPSPALPVNASNTDRSAQSFSEFLARTNQTSYAGMSPAQYAELISKYGFGPPGGGAVDLVTGFAPIVAPFLFGGDVFAGGEAGTAMPPAIPEPDPTFGGVLQQTAPGVFEATAGANALGTAAGPPILPSTDLPSPSFDFAAPPLASAGVSYAGLPAGDPAAPGVYGGLAPGDYNAGTSLTAAGADYGLEATNPLDWLKQLSKTASPYLNLASAGLGLYSAGRAGKTPSPAPVYDPFAGQRAQYQQQLSRLSADPNYLTELPGYKAGLEATRRGMAAGGYNLSGNEEAALFQYGGNIYNQEATRLANLAGANVGPMVSGASPSNVAQAELVSRSLASLGYAAKSLGAGV